MPLKRFKSSARFVLVFFIVTLTPLLSSCGHYIRSEHLWQSALSQDHSLVGDIIRTSDYRRVQPNDLISQISTADYVLIGEKHDNPDHHHIQNWILTHLLPKEKYRLVFEMMDYSQQDQLDKLNSNSLEDDILKASKLDKSGWEKQHYLPLIQTGLAKGADIVGGNVPKEDLMSIYQEGFSSIEAKDRFSTLGAIEAPVQELIKEEIYQQHCKMIPIKKTTPMVNIQIAKDASLSFAMSQDSKNKSVLIAGNYHVNKDVGVPKHLTQSQPEKTALVIQILEVSNEYDTLKSLQNGDFHGADYLWFTPRWTDKDYCEDMKAQMHKSSQ